MAKNYIFKNEPMNFTERTSGSRRFLIAPLFEHIEITAETPEDFRKYSIEIDGEKYVFADFDGGPIFTKDGTFNIDAFNEHIYLNPEVEVG